MNEIVLQHEATIRLSFFLGIFATMALWEVMAPRRRRMAPTALRWLSNLGLVAVNTAVLRVAFPMLAVGMATLSAERGWGV